MKAIGDCSACGEQMEVEVGEDLKRSDSDRYCQRCKEYPLAALEIIRRLHVDNANLRGRVEKLIQNARANEDDLAMIDDDYRRRDDEFRRLSFEIQVLARELDERQKSALGKRWRRRGL